MHEVKRVAILGSTGSIGRKTLDVLASLGNDYKIVALAGGMRWEEVAAQADQCGARYVGIGAPDLEAKLSQRMQGRATVFGGRQGLVELVEASECDCLVSAIVGTAGLRATLRAVELGKKVAIANKETLVVAGPLITERAQRSGATLIPIDSEHSAIFQALHSGKQHEVHRIYLTSSGGPLRTWTLEQIREAKLADALAHPVWDMGPKITIDSATMMNKALEIVEARWLFHQPRRNIEVLIHPEAIIHSMVEFRDGCLIAQLGTPDMRIPIQYALTYPHRRASCGTPLDMMSIRQLHFEPPDVVRFPALQLGFDVAEKGGTLGAVLNAANEKAVEAFRDGRIKFGEISDLTADALSKHRCIECPSFDELLAADQWAREEVHACVNC